MTTTPPLGSDAARFPAVRLAVGYAAIAGTVPYLVLKTMWLTGSSVGVVDRAFLRDPSVLVLNGVTAGMDVVILVALALTHRWGERLPAWLVLTPMWVGTGFLAPIAVALPVVALGEALTSAAPPSVAVASPALPLEPWVQPMVYAGFAWQGITLLAAFVLYARVRWAEVFRPSIAPLGAAHAAHAAVANGAALLALTAAGVHLLWAFGGTAGLSDEAAAARDLTSSLTNGTHGLAGLAAAAGILAMVHRPRTPGWLPLTATWVGAAAMFSWGLWSMVNVLGRTALVSSTGGAVLNDLLNFGKVLAGLVIGLVLLFVLAERRHPLTDRLGTAPAAAR